MASSGRITITNDRAGTEYSINGRPDGNGIKVMKKWQVYRVIQALGVPELGGNGLLGERGTQYYPAGTEQFIFTASPAANPEEVILKFKPNPKFL